MWNSILEVLERKIKQGVEVRLMYDDLGCLLTLPRHYDRVLRAKGLRVCVFNPFNSVLSSRFNNRDHRKICIIDGKEMCIRDSKCTKQAKYFDDEAFLSHVAMLEAHFKDPKENETFL